MPQYLGMHPSASRWKNAATGHDNVNPYAALQAPW